MEILDCNALFGGIRSEEERYDPGDVLAMMDKAGISRALAASTIGCFANFVLANNETAEVCKEHGRLIPVGTIHPTSYTDAENEIEECRDRGFKAFRLYTEFYGADFDGGRGWIPIAGNQGGHQSHFRGAFDGDGFIISD